MFGVDVDAEVSEAVGKAVRNEVRKQLAGIATEAVATILNEDTVAALHARALQAADQAVQEELNADTASAQRDLEADVDEEPAAETFYGNVDEFVREFLVVTYRVRFPVRAPTSGTPAGGCTRGRRAPRRALAGLGAPAPRPRHRHERVVA